MLWSILIAAIPERFHSVQPLLHSLLTGQKVANIPEIELLYLLDNKRRTVGEKRNALLAAAQGDYISFIDDDDEVSGAYVEKLYGAIIKTRRETPPADVICFPQYTSIAPHGIIHECSYSLTNKERKIEATPQTGVLKWSGPPAHTMLWRRELVAALRFPEQQFQEDTSWCDAASALAKTEEHVTGAPLYFYKFDEDISATRG